MSEREHYLRLRALFLAARELPEAEREELLDRRGADEPRLASEVRELLAHDAVDEHPGGAGEEHVPTDRGRGPGSGRMGAAGAAEESLQGTASADTADWRPGELVGPYEVIRVLGSGAMGTVYEALDTRLGRTVALKFLHEDLTESPLARERFLREARAASALDHPNLCTLYDVGESDGHTYLAMACYRGETLGERLTRGALPVDEALAIGLGVARGLAAAHARGIVHRDIKPANLLLPTAGGVKILDFGIAKLVDQAGLTPSDAALGTPGHMAPEQVLREKVGPSADVWSTGVLLFEMLTGESPFSGESHAALLYAVLHETPRRLAEVAPQVPEWLAAVVDHCLARQPAARYPDAGALLAALEHGAGESAAVAARGSSRPSWPLAVGLALVAALALLALWRSPLGGASRPAIGSLAVLPFAHPAGDTELEQLGGGLTARITHHLSRLDGLTVIASSSSGQLAGDGSAPAKIAERLGVEGLVIGNLARRGGTIVVDAQLIEPATGRQLWGNRFDEGPQDLIGLESDLSRQIAQTLRRRLSGEETSRLTAVGTADPAAHRDYLIGLHLKSKLAYAEAVRAFERATIADPEFAAAWAGLASAHAYMALFGRVQPETAYALAQRAATRALELDAGLGDAWASLAQARFFGRGDLAGALAAAERSVALDPGSAQGHYVLGALAIAADRQGTALAELARSMELDPLAPGLRLQLGRAHMRRHEWHEAIVVSQENVALHPELGVSRSLLVRALARAGRRREAVAAAAALDPAGYRRWPVLTAEERPAARAQLADWDEEWKAQPRGGVADADHALHLLEAHLILGDRAASLDWMETLAGLPGGALMIYQVLPWPEVDPLRGEPRLRAILARIGAPASFGSVPPAEPAPKLADGGA